MEKQIDHIKKKKKTVILSWRVTIHRYLFRSRPVARLWKGEEKAIEHPEEKKLSLPRSSIYQPRDKATLISTRGHIVPWPQAHENNNLQSSIKHSLDFVCSVSFLRTHTPELAGSGCIFTSVCVCAWVCALHAKIGGQDLSHSRMAFYRY